MSSPSTITLVPLFAVLHFPLEDLCGFIDTYPSIQKACIVRSRTFVERKRIAPHRCLVVELHRVGRKVAWLRLERKPTSPGDLVMGGGKTRSNDVVGVFIHRRHLVLSNFEGAFKCCLAAKVDALLDERQYKLDNEEFYPSSPTTLEDLRRLLLVAHEELNQYAIWPVSVIASKFKFFAHSACRADKLLDVVLVPTTPLWVWRSWRVGSWGSPTRKFGDRRAKDSRV